VCPIDTRAPDSLLDEPGGYTNFNGLFGAAYVNPIIKQTGR